MKNQKKISLDQIAKTNVFMIPEGYFLSLPSTIEQKILVPGVVLKQPVFILPKEYFEQLPQQIISRLPVEKLSLEKLKQSPFSVPNSYFNELSEKIKTTPLPGKTNELILTVPEEYFDTLPYKIQDRIREKKREVIIPLYERASFRYAIAACFVGLLLLGFAVIFNNTAPPDTELAEETLPSKSNLAITLIENLNKEEIKEYLEKQDNLEVAQLMEYSSPEKKEKIRKEFEKDFINIPLNEVDKKTLEIELNDIDLSDLDVEI